MFCYKTKRHHVSKIPEVAFILMFEKLLQLILTTDFDLLEVVNYIDSTVLMLKCYNTLSVVMFKN